MSSFVGLQPLSRQASARWWWMIGVTLVVIAASYIFFVRTYTGQYLENSALIGASQQATASQVGEALEQLHVISYVSLAAALAAIVVIGFIRKSWRIAAAGVFTLAGATVTTEILKKLVLARPNLADIYQDNAHNSFPSGHTTIAMSILAALLIVVPYRWRGVVMFFTLAWSTAVGAATITARWHRFSDTLSADMIALLFAAVALLWLGHHKMIGSEVKKKYPLRVIYVAVVTAVGFISLVLGLLLGIMVFLNYGLGSAAATAASNAASDPEFTRNMFLAAQSLASGFSILSALWLWLTMHRLESRALNVPGAKS